MLIAQSVAPFGADTLSFLIQGLRARFARTCPWLPSVRACGARYFRSAFGDQGGVLRFAPHLPWRLLRPRLRRSLLLAAPFATQGRRASLRSALALATFPLRLRRALAF